jgi:hypothetical protein
MRKHKRLGGILIVGALGLTLVSACSEQAQAPMVTSVCDLAAHVQRVVQLDALIEVEPDGRTVISDAKCASTKVELRLSAAATRSGAAERLQAAAQRASGSGKRTIAATLTGVLANTTTGYYFNADSVLGL